MPTPKPATAKVRKKLERVAQLKLAACSMVLSLPAIDGPKATWLPLVESLLAIWMVGERGLESRSRCPEHLRSVQWAGKMVAIPAGSFRMGRLSGADGRNGRPVHTVRLSAFEIGAHEVTVGQYRAFVKDSGYHVGNDFSQYNKHDDKPAPWGG